ncbi:hypothetical protein ACP4OV_009289 [Aristida adscensionis]
MKVLEDLIAPAVVADLVSRVISFLVTRHADRARRRAGTSTSSSSTLRLELLALKIHAVVDEAEGRHIAGNRRLLLWLGKLMEGMYRAYYALDATAHGSPDHDGVFAPATASSSWSLPFSRLVLPTKRLRAAAAAGVDHPDAVLARLEEATEDMKEFILLLACCPRRILAPPSVVSSFRSGEKAMFGRLVEREQMISFLLQPGSDLGVLPVIGGPEVGKSTIVKHVCSDERVRGHFSLILYSYGSLIEESKSWGDDVLATLRAGGHVLHESSASTVSGHGRRLLLVIKNSHDVVIDRVAWAELCASLRPTAPGSKIVVISDREDDGVADLGTAPAMRVRPLPPEEYWYFFMSLALGGEDTGRRRRRPPELAALGMRIAGALRGSFFGAKVLGGLLRMNLDARFWCAALNAVRRLRAAQARRRGDDGGGAGGDHLSKLDVAEIALKTLPVPLRLKSCCQTEVASGSPPCPGVTVQQLLRSPTSVPGREEEEVRVVLWESAYPPSYRYTVVCEKVEKRPCEALERKRRFDP